MQGQSRCALAPCHKIVAPRLHIVHKIFIKIKLLQIFEHAFWNYCHILLSCRASPHTGSNILRNGTLCQSARQNANQNVKCKSVIRAALAYRITQSLISPVHISIFTILHPSLYWPCGTAHWFIVWKIHHWAITLGYSSLLYTKEDIAG